jgi:UDP-N-acetylmuramoyl-L-alanyl-D-glutamate--2,6-diaminopimelate ligase
MVVNKKKLFDILPQGEITEVIGDTDRWVSTLTIDSRACKEDSVFFAFSGTATDGHRFIPSAIQHGATTVICERWPEEGLMPDVTYLKVKNARKMAGLMAASFFGHVSDHITLVGVTGTNGKTTVATLLFQLFTALGHTCGLISTVENKISDRVIPATHTTPDVISLHRLLAEMNAEGCSHVFMEVSSHAIVQERIGGLKFSVAVFTNLTQDHLDYHGTMENYIGAKKLFFDHLPKGSFALINLDDKRGKVMVQNTKAEVKTYSLRTMADCKGSILDNNILGLYMKVNGEEAYFKLIGDFNAYNILAAYGTAVILGKTPGETLTALSGLSGPAGRFEQVVDPETGTCGIVDYAHTPDAVENVLDTIRKVKSPAARIITVVGCGGDRDKSKRSIMARIAAEKSDLLIMTSDNPRTEDPEAILDDMQAGIPEEAEDKCLRISDRKTAINTAVRLSGKGDVILVAGKGHENYQEIMGVKTPFNDKKLLTEYLVKSRV